MPIRPSAESEMTESLKQERSTPARLAGQLLGVPVSGITDTHGHTQCLLMN